jgi:trans-2,3-dihydro-3-hydroxyanthranilate isomerase
VGPELPVDLVAVALGLAPRDIVTESHAPRVASVGLPFVMVEVAGLEVLGRARADVAALERLAAVSGVTPDVHVYTRAGQGPAAGGARPAPGLAPPDLRARMFAPFDGVPEDPATGSANAALAGLLADHDPRTDGELRWTIAQGVEMGRPSRLEARVTKRGGTVSGVWIGGRSVLVAEGTLQV